MRDHRQCPVATYRSAGQWQVLREPSLPITNIIGLQSCSESVRQLIGFFNVGNYLSWTVLGVCHAGQKSREKNEDTRAKRSEAQWLKCKHLMNHEIVFYACNMKVMWQNDFQNQIFLWMSRKLHKSRWTWKNRSHWSGFFVVQCISGTSAWGCCPSTHLWASTKVLCGTEQYRERDRW